MLLLAVPIEEFALRKSEGIPLVVKDQISRVSNVPPDEERARKVLAAAALATIGYGVYHFYYKRKKKIVVEAQGEQLVKAVCVLSPDGGSGVYGFLDFVQKEEGRTHVDGVVKGLDPGEHGVHIHEFGDLRKGKVRKFTCLRPKGVLPRGSITIPSKRNTVVRTTTKDMLEI